MEFKTIGNETDTLSEHVRKISLEFPSEKVEFWNRLLKMKGKEIYEQYGMKRDETITITANFGDGYEMDIKLVIPLEEDELPWTEAVLFKNGSELSFTEPDDEFVQEWILESDGLTFICIISKS